MRSAAMQSLTNDIEARHPGVTIWGIGDDAHKTHPSDHNEDDTAGSKAAQSDSDSVPEHRAIDVKVDGTYITDTEMQAIIDEILADPYDLARLIYINYKNWQWSASTGWGSGHDNSDDPHPTHAHFSGKASKDEDGAPWLTGGTEVELRATRGMGQNGAPPSDNTKLLQRLLNIIVAGDPRLTDTTHPAYHPLTVDGNYGGNTAYWVSVQGPGGNGDIVDGDWFGKFMAMATDRTTRDAMAAHLTNTEHGGGELPATVELTIPEQSYTIPAQTVIATII